MGFSMKNLINPATCPYRSRVTIDGHPVCTFCSKDEEEFGSNKKDERDEDDEDYKKNKQIADSSGSDYDNKTDETYESDKLDIDYEYSFNGESLDVQDASDIDVSFDGMSAEFDFDYDGDFGSDFDGGDNNGGDSDGSDGNGGNGSDGGSGDGGDGGGSDGD